MDREGAEEAVMPYVKVVNYHSICMAVMTKTMKTSDRVADNPTYAMGMQKL
jgi:hypothetical protein